MVWRSVAKDGRAEQNNVKVEGLPQGPKAGIAPEQILTVLPSTLAMVFPLLAPTTQEHSVRAPARACPNLTRDHYYDVSRNAGSGRVIDRQVLADRELPLTGHLWASPLRGSADR